MPPLYQCAPSCGEDEVVVTSGPADYGARLQIGMP
jgi:hypothetical protein